MGREIPKESDDVSSIFYISIKLIFLIFETFILIRNTTFEKPFCHCLLLLLSSFLFYLFDQTCIGGQLMIMVYSREGTEKRYYK